MTLEKVDAVTECRASVEKEKKILIKSECGESFAVNYKLVYLRLPYDMFVMAAECGEEGEGVCLGTEMERAEKVFSLVCSYGVMPGVLAETVAELEL